MADPDQKALVDAIIDEQIDAKALAEEAYRAGVSGSDAVIRAGRRIYAEVKVGKITKARARELMREAFSAVALAEYAALAQKVADLADEHTVKQRNARKRYGKKLSTLPMVRDIDIKARENEKAGLDDGSE